MPSSQTEPEAEARCKLSMPAAHWAQTYPEADSGLPDSEEAPPERSRGPAHAGARSASADAAATCHRARAQRDDSMWAGHTTQGGTDL